MLVIYFCVDVVVVVAAAVGVRQEDTASRLLAGERDGLF